MPLAETSEDAVARAMPDAPPTTTAFLPLTSTRRSFSLFQPFGTLVRLIPITGTT